MRFKSKKTEFNHFSRLSGEWWAKNGKFKILHDIQPIRIKFIQNAINKQKLNKIKILDVGCGGGDVLRRVHHWCQKNRINARLIGLDGNLHVVELAREFSHTYSGIDWQVVNVFSPEFGDHTADVFMFNLFLHHFQEEEIVALLKKCRTGCRFLIINDLQRSRLAYQLFRLASRVFRFSYISRHDGKLSIRKSFTKGDWVRMLQEAGISRYRIKWQWAFRYSVLITFS